MFEDLKKITNSLFFPDEYRPSIYDIDFSNLSKRGYKGFLIDLDNTLVSRYEDEPSLKCQRWVEDAKLAGFSLCILSNSFYPRRVQYVSEILKLPAIYMSAKPFNWSLKIAINDILKLSQKEVVLIGDQLFTDILAGNLMGIYNILVDPIDKEKISLKKLVRFLEELTLKYSDIKALNEK